MEHTEKLFYAQPPVLEFTARVLECEEDKNGWQVVLDRTAFYPEGGGQPADQGLLGGVRVLDVHEKEGVIRHLTDGPLTAGPWRVGVSAHAVITRPCTVHLTVEEERL